MSQAAELLDRSERLAEISRLCAKIGHAVERSDWDDAMQMLSRRHQMLEKEFAQQPETVEEAEQLRMLAEQVMAFDRDLMPHADAMRGETLQELKKLRLGREATQVYAQNAG